MCISYTECPAPCVYCMGNNIYLKNCKVVMEVNLLNIMALICFQMKADHSFSDMNSSIACNSFVWNFLKCLFVMTFVRAFYGDKLFLAMFAKFENVINFIFFLWKVASYLRPWDFFACDYIKDYIQNSILFNRCIM